MSVHRAYFGNKAIGGTLFYQILHGNALSLGGKRERSILNSSLPSHQIFDIFSNSALISGTPFRYGFWPRFIEGYAVSFN